jgi:hypothetical protein
VLAESAQRRAEAAVESGKRVLALLAERTRLLRIKLAETKRPRTVAT